MQYIMRYDYQTDISCGIHITFIFMSVQNTFFSKIDNGKNVITFSTTQK